MPRRERFERSLQRMILQPLRKMKAAYSTADRLVARTQRDFVPDLLISGSAIKGQCFDLQFGGAQFELGDAPAATFRLRECQHPARDATATRLDVNIHS